MEFRTLKADEIDVKVGNVTSNGYTLLLYKNARVDMAILDETVSAEGWQRDHKEVKGNLYCGIGVKLTKDSDWVWKWDCGVESAFGDKEKGEASDSFKRARFNWGIGRELYTSPRIFIECQTAEEKDKNGKVVYKLPNTEKYRTFRVKEIECNKDKEITKLVIVDNKGVQVYPKSIVITKENATITASGEVHCVDCDDSVSKKVAEYSLSRFGKVLCYDCQKTQKPKEVEL